MKNFFNSNHSTFFNSSLDDTNLFREFENTLQRKLFSYKIQYEIEKYNSKSFIEDDSFEKQSPEWYWLNSYGLIEENRKRKESVIESEPDFKQPEVYLPKVVSKNDFVNKILEFAPYENPYMFDENISFGNFGPGNPNNICYMYPSSIVSSLEGGADSENVVKERLLALLDILMNKKQGYEQIQQTIADRNNRLFEILKYHSSEEEEYYELYKKKATYIRSLKGKGDNSTDYQQRSQELENIENRLLELTKEFKSYSDPQMLERDILCCYIGFKTDVYSKILYNTDKVMMTSSGHINLMFPIARDHYDRTSPMFNKSLNTSDFLGEEGQKEDIDKNPFILKKYTTFAYDENTKKYDKLVSDYTPGYQELFYDLVQWFIYGYSNKYNYILSKVDVDSIGRTQANNGIVDTLDYDKQYEDKPYAHFQYFVFNKPYSEKFSRVAHLTNVGARKQASNIIDSAYTLYLSHLGGGAQYINSYNSPDSDDDDEVQPSQDIAEILPDIDEVLSQDKQQEIQEEFIEKMLNAIEGAIEKLDNDDYKNYFRLFLTKLREDETRIPYYTEIVDELEKKTGKKLSNISIWNANAQLQKIIAVFYPNFADIVTDLSGFKLKDNELAYVTTAKDKSKNKLGQTLETLANIRTLNNFVEFVFKRNTDIREDIEYCIGLIGKEWLQFTKGERPGKINKDTNMIENIPYSSNTKLELEILQKTQLNIINFLRAYIILDDPSKKEYSNSWDFTNLPNITYPNSPSYLTQDDINNNSYDSVLHYLTLNITEGITDPEKLEDVKDMEDLTKEDINVFLENKAKKKELKETKSVEEKKIYQYGKRNDDFVIVFLISYIKKLVSDKYGLWFKDVGEPSLEEKKETLGEMISYVFENDWKRAQKIGLLNIISMLYGHNGTKKIIKNTKDGGKVVIDLDLHKFIGTTNSNDSDDEDLTDLVKDSDEDKDEDTTVCQAAVKLGGNKTFGANHIGAEDIFTESMFDKDMDNYLEQIESGKDIVEVASQMIFDIEEDKLNDEDDTKRKNDKSITDDEDEENAYYNDDDDDEE